MQTQAPFESVQRKIGDEEVHAENLEITRFSLENFSPPTSSQRQCFKAEIQGDRDCLSIEKVEESLTNEFSERSIKKPVERQSRISKKYNTRISFLKSEFSIENHRLVEQIESPDIFVLYSEKKNEILSVLFWNTILPHFLAIFFFLVFHFIMNFIELACFMKNCPCPSDNYLKKSLFSLKEIFMQMNFFIFPFYLIFYVRSFKYSTLQKLLYFCLIPAIFLLILFSDGEGEYPIITKNLILSCSFLLHILINFLKKFKGRRSELWNYFKLTVVVGFMSMGAYYFTNFLLRPIKEFTFQLKFGDFFFAIFIWIVTRFNTFLLNLTVHGFEKLLKSEKINYNPLLYFIKFFLTVQYGFKISSVGQLNTLSLAFAFSLISLIFSLLRFHFRFSPLLWFFRKLFRRTKNRPGTFSLKEAAFVQKITSFQRFETVIIYGSRMVYIYFSKRLINQHSKETTEILDCSYNLKSEPNYINLFIFLLFDLLTSGFIVVYVKKKKLNHLKYIADNHNVFVKAIIYLALAIQTEYYMFHLVSIAPEN